MPDLQFDFTLNDSMASGLKSITNALAGMLNYLEDVNKSVGGLENSNFDALKKSVSGACVQVNALTQDVDLAADSVSGLNKSNFNNLNKQTGNVVKGIESINSAAEGVTSSLKGIDGSGLSELKRETETVSEGIDDIGSASQRLGKEFQNLNNINVNPKGLSDIQKSANESTNAVLDVGDAVKSTLGEVDKLNGSSLSGIDTRSAVSGINQLESEISSAIGDVKKLDNTSINGLRQEARKVSSGIEKIGTEANDVKSDLKEISQIDLDNGSAQSLSDSLSSINDALNLSNFMDISEIIGDATEKLGDFVGTAMDAAEVMGNGRNKLDIALNTSGNRDVSGYEDAAFKAYLDNYGDYEDLIDKTIFTEQMFGPEVPSADMTQFLEQYQTFEEVGNMDFKETVRGAKNFSNAFETSVQKTSDLFAVAMGRGLNFSEEFGDNMAEYTSLFQGSGWAPEEFLAIGDIGKQTGAYNLDKVFDFMKEFQIILNDGTMEENIMRFGVDSATFDTFAKFQDGIATSRDVFAAMMSDMQAMPEVARKSLTSDLLSSLGEDNSMQMIMSLDIGNIEEVANEVYGNVEGAAQAAADKNGTAVGQIKRYWEALPLALAPIGESIAQVIVGIIDVAGSIGSTISGLWNGTITFPDLTQQGLDLINSFVNGFMTGLPQMVTQGFEVVTNFIKGVIQKVPEMALGAVDMIVALATSIGENLPTIMQKAGETIQAFVSGIATNLPAIIATGITAIQNFLSGIFQRLPDIISAAGKLITGFLTGLVQMLPSIISAGVELVLSLSMGILQYLPTLAQNGLELVGSIISGLARGIPQLIFEAFQLIIKVAAAIVSAIPNIISSALEIGKNIILGIKDGFIGAWDGFWSWISEKFNSVVDFVKQIFGIASPSTVFIDIGDNLIVGFLDGLKGAWNSVTEWFGQAWQGLKDTVTGWWNNIWGGGEEEEEAQPDIDYTETINNVKAQMEQLKAEVQAGFGEITNQAMAATTTMAAQTLTAYANLTQTVTAQTGQLAQNVSAQLLGIDITPLGVKLISELTSVLSTLSNSAASAVADLVSKVSANLTPLVSAFGATFTSITQNSLKSLEALYSQSISLLGNIAKESQAQITLMSSTIVNAFNAMAKTATSTLTGLSITATGAVKSMTTGMLSAIASFSTSYLGSWNTLSSQTISMIEKMSSDVLSQMKNLAKGIQDRIGSLPQYFSATAQVMMGNLRSGISSRIGDVTSEAGKLVQQLKSTFEQGLGIHSPSDYMIWVGQMMLQGLLQGMSGSQVQNFIENMIAGMQSSFEKGSFDANKLVNFLSDGGVMNLIGRISGIDMKDANPQQIAYPLIGTLGTQTSWFGNREAPTAGASTNHGGVDLATDAGTPIAAALAGVVNFAGESDGYGNLVTIDHGNGIETYYGHMSSIATTLGATVAKGQMIGAVGSTGISTGPHLHFEVRQNGNRIDPQPYLEGAGLAGAGNTLTTAIQNAYNLKHGIITGATMQGSVAYNPSAGAAQWTDTVLQALRIIGQPESLAGAVLATLDAESTGNPNAINDWDSNWYKGTPSKGLMQVIDPTFQQYALPGYNNDIWDPLSNILASLNYQLQVYGGIRPQLNGYEVGTRYVPYDMPAYIHKGEAIIPASQNPYTNSGGDYLADLFDYEPHLRTEGVATPTGSTSNSYSIEFNITQNIDDSSDPRALANEVLDRLYDQIEAECKSEGGGISAIY